MNNLMFFLDVAGMLVTLIAIILLSRKDKNGWIWQFIGNLVWISVGIYHGTFGLVILNVIIAAISIYSYQKWKSQSLQ